MYFRPGPGAGLKSYWRVTAMAVVPLLSACSSLQPLSTPPPADNPLLTALATEQALNSADSTPSGWWQTFADAQLNQLVDSALRHNYSLQASLARLQSSAALVRQQDSDLYPSVDLNAGKNRSWRRDSSSDQWSAGLTASYELDFWGALAASRDQAGFNLYSSQAAARLQANTVAAQVAGAWFGYVKEQRQLVLLEQQQQRIDAGLTVINARFQRGRAQVSDVWQQQTLLESINSDVIQARASRDIYYQQLQLWLGDSAPVAGQDGAQLPDIHDAHSQVTLAAVSQRPDVQRAWYEVQAAYAGVAVAEAARYPRFTLSASYTGQAPQLEDVFDNWMANLAANLVLPLIDGGQRRAQLDARQATLDATLAEYQQSLLAAAQEVQQQLVREREQQALAGSINRRLLLARKNEAFQSSRYAKGVGDFLSLLTAQREVLALERQLLANQFSAVQTRIALYQAVSHGRFSATETAVNTFSSAAQTQDNSHL